MEKTLEELLGSCGIFLAVTLGLLVRELLTSLFSDIHLLKSWYVVIRLLQ